MIPSLLLLLGCPNLNPTYVDQISGSAFLFNNTDRALTVQIETIEMVDCAVVQFPGLAASIVAPGISQTLSIDSGEVIAAWNDSVDSGFFGGEEACIVGRVTLEDETVTVAFSQYDYAQVDIPATLGGLPRQTIVLQDTSPRLSNGAGFISTPSSTPTCEQQGPTWSGSTGHATILGHRHEGHCEILELSTTTELSVCDGPPLPFLVGEDLTTTIEDDRFSVTTAAGGKPYLLSRTSTLLPSWIELQPFSDGETWVRDEGCQMPATCGAALAANVSIRTATFGAAVFWGDQLELTSPTGSRRNFTLYNAGVPMLDGCPLQATFALTPRTQAP